MKKLIWMILTGYLSASLSSRPLLNETATVPPQPTASPTAFASPAAVEAALPAEINIAADSVHADMDLAETAFHAAARLQQDAAADRRVSNAVREAYPLHSLGRIAQIPPLAGTTVEYLSLFLIGDRPAYCVEPNVLVKLNGAAGPQYQADAWRNTRPQTAERVKRLAWYGYGHPRTGTSNEAYIATQLLIWQAVVPDLYDTINAGLQLCEQPGYQPGACTAGRGQVDEIMASIADLAERHDTVPSFVDEWHGTKTWRIDWDQTLVLEDQNGVLDWFEAEPQESHAGIHLKRDGSRLLADIDSLYYEGYDSANGKTLTFRRDPAQWENMLNGILLYTSGSSQKLLGIDGIDPTPEFRLAFRLNTADLEVIKQDEYGPAGSAAAGTSFMLAWQEDPETQYEAEGGGDQNWTEYHSFHQTKKDDLDGSGNIADTRQLYYPIQSADGSGIRPFAASADGILRVSGFLPAGKTWWIREVAAADPHRLDSRIWSAQTNEAGSRNSVSFVNGLRDVTLNVIKQEEQTTNRQINDAAYTIYEIPTAGKPLDLDKTPTEYGSEINLHRLADGPVLTFGQLQAHTGLNVGDSFVFNGYQFEIKAEEAAAYTVQARKAAAQPEAISCKTLSRYQLPQPLTVGSQFVVRDILRQHGTLDPADDEVSSTQMTVAEIQPTGQGHQVKVSRTDPKKNILANRDTVVKYADFVAAAALQNVPLLPGSRVVIDHVAYRLANVNEGSLIARIETDAWIDLSDPAPVYSDLPDPLALHAGDVFSLRYPAAADDGTFAEASQQFTVMAADAAGITLQTEDQILSVAVPEWISYQDVPAEIEQPEQFTVSGIVPPVYEAEDSRGNVYQVAAEDTALLKQSTEEASAVDLSYAALVTGRQDAAAADAAALSGACGEPYDPAGCPIGTVRQFLFQKTQVIPYAGPQYDDLSEQERSLSSGASFSRADVSYTVIAPDDGISMHVSFLADGQTYEAELAAGSHAEQAVHQEPVEISFRITSRTEKEFDLCWDTMQVPDNSLTQDASIHLAAFTDEEGQGDLRWIDLSENDRQEQAQFTVNGILYTVLYSDPINQKMIAESAHGRYLMTPDQTKNITPISYRQCLAFEQSNGSDAFPAGKALAVGDQMQVMVRQPLQPADEFSIGSTSYLLQADDYVQDRSSETLRQAPDYTKTVLFPWSADAPFSPKELMHRLAEGSVFSQNDQEYSWQQETADRYSLSSREGKNWTYCRLVLKDAASHQPYEQTDPQWTLRISRPVHPTYEECMQAIHQLKDSKQPFLAAGQKYLLLSETTEPEKGRILHLKDAAGQPKEVPEFPDSPFYETERILSYAVGRSYHLNEQFPKAARIELEAENPHIVLQADPADSSQVVLQADGNASAVLCLYDASGGLLQRQRIVTGSLESAWDGIPVFRGRTGRQYLRLTDAANHHMPIPYAQVKVYQDAQLTRFQQTLQADEYGAVDLIDLPEGTYYWHGIGADDEVHALAVVRPDSRQGQLKVENLKWGRTYLACEFGLPDGYDYGKTEVCQPFTMALKPGTNLLNSVLENRRRTLEVQVFKRDAEDQNLLLNNTWFTAADVTDLRQPAVQEASTLASAVRLADLPPEAAVGDVFAVWRAKTNGIRHRYRIEHVDSQQAAVCLFDGNQAGQMFFVPVHGVSDRAPMLYSDIRHAVSAVQAGAVFTVTEKEDRRALRQYRVLALTRQPEKDLFSIEDTMKILQATVADITDSAALPITVQQITGGSTAHGVHLGTFVTGGILTEVHEQIPSLPLSWQQLMDQAGSWENLQPGLMVSARLTAVAAMPDYAAAQQLLHLDQPKAFAASRCFDYAGLSWTAEAGADGQLILHAAGATIHLAPDTVPGAIRYQCDSRLEVIRVWLDQAGKVSAVTLQAPDQKQYYLREGMQVQMTEAGRPGVSVQVSDKQGNQIRSGYTDAAGQLLFADLPDGEYSVSRDGAVETVNVERGKITLPKIPYGHSIELCEIRSPLGYLTGEVCKVIVPQAEYTVDTVRNDRPNSKYRRRRRQLAVWRMGVSDG